MAVRNSIYKYLFFGIVLFYSLFLGRIGFENWDTGYIPSFAWRIVNGSSPYQDFIYKGPPVTLYFQALWMYILPENGQFFFIKISNYWLFALQVFLLVSAFDKIYNLKNKGFNKWAVMSCGFILSLLNFPCYPWPTTDGLLFASVAFYVMATARNFSISRLLTIAFFCLLSALTKQSFYLVPIAFSIWIFSTRNWHKAFVFVACLLVLLSGFLLFIASITTLETYFQMTTGETHLDDLIYIGFHEYKSFFRNSYVVLILMILTTILVLWKSRKKSKIKAVFQWLPIVVFIVAIAMALAKEILVASQIAFVASAVALVSKLGLQKEKIAYLAPIAVTLTVAWSCSISLGYSYPIFYATGILLSFFVLMADEIKELLQPKYYLLIGIPVALVGASYAYRPYREQTLPNLTYSLETVSPKLKFMLASKANLEKNRELKNLVAKYGPDFIVAPGMPIANYIFNQTSNLPADWILNTEVNRQYDLFLTLASDSKNYIFLEKSFLEGEEMSNPIPKNSSLIAWKIYRDFRRVGETRYFIVYNSVQP